MAGLLAAEQTRLDGRPREALNLYQRAADLAGQQDCPHHAALALERKGWTFLKLRRIAEATEALRVAAARYRAWGAQAKAAALHAECADLSRSLDPP
jgi:tetratricopeptide (TPR) repeat protein